MRFTATITLASLIALGACSGGATASSQSPSPPLAAPAPAPTPTPTPTPAPATVPASQAAAQIGPCVNMANHLEAPNEGEWGRAIAEDDFTIIAAAGFKTVRLPVRWSAHAGAGAPYTIDPAFLARVDHVVALARTANLRVILNMQHYDELFVTPAAQAARFTAIWRQIGAHFRGADDNVWFELINEPHDALGDANLLATLDPARLAVRETNPTRKIVFGGRNYSGIDSLATLPLPADPNIIATFHYYDPFNFTHQGATWVSPSPPLGRTFPSGSDTNDLARSVQKARDYMARTGVPVFMGEYGAYDVVPLAQRAGYYRAVRDGFAAAGVDGCVWGYTNSFAFRVGTVWQQDLLRAIGL